MCDEVRQHADLLSVVLPAVHLVVSQEDRAPVVVEVDGEQTDFTPQAALVQKAAVVQQHHVSRSDLLLALETLKQRPARRSTVSERCVTGRVQRCVTEYRQRCVTDIVTTEI